jgi:hypothetical protein
MFKCKPYEAQQQSADKMQNLTNVKADSTNVI